MWSRDNEESSSQASVVKSTSLVLSSPNRTDSVQWNSLLKKIGFVCAIICQVCVFGVVSKNLDIKIGMTEMIFALSAGLIHDHPSYLDGLLKAV